jgi:two-component system sensor histidine kinase/response regulator
VVPGPGTAADPVITCPVKVLIVDDHAINRHLYHALCSRWGMHPEVVAGGREALETAANRGRPFTLVLLDADMPEIDGFDVSEAIAARSDLADAVIMMLAASGPYNDGSRCAQLRRAAHLVKPITPGDLLAAIQRVLPTGVQPAATPPAATVTAATPSPVGLSARVILLAEDNVVNQRVAAGLLRRRGHTVVVANNGLEALATLEDQRFDLVLMDLQMPQMGGLEATRRIRDRERDSGRHTRVVAMTADAMTGDRERCLAAGMDGYLSKPVDPLTLFTAVEQETLAEDAVETARVLHPVGGA